MIIKCPNCISGKVSVGQSVYPCRICKGTCEVSTVNPPEEIERVDTCEGCHGSGKISGKTCSFCAGRGLITYPPPEQEAKANSYMIGGNHYKSADGGEEHWDRVARLKLDYFQACTTKYIERWKKKNGLEDLKKAQHYLQKYIELIEANGGRPLENTEQKDESF